MTSPRRFLANLSLACAGLLAAVAMLEMGCRAAIPQWRHIWPQEFLRFDRELGAFLGRPGYAGRMANIYGEFDVPVELDAQGFRNPPGTSGQGTALLVLGDSFGFGWGVRQEENFASVAGRELARPVRNLSVPAADLSDELILAEAFGRSAAEPALVCAVTFENDIRSYPPPETASPGRPEPGSVAVITWSIEHSALVSVSFAALSRTTWLVSMVRRMGLFVTSSAPESPDRDPLAASADMLEAIRIRSGTPRFVVLCIPPRPQFGTTERYASFVRLLAGRGMEVVDPGVQEGDFFPKDGHWTAAAHARAGRLVAARLAAGPPP